MELKVSKSQKQGMFRQVYVLSARLEVSDEERALIKKLKLNDATVFDGNDYPGLPPSFINVDAILRGYTIECSTPEAVETAAEVIRQSCFVLNAQVKREGRMDGREEVVKFD